MIGARSWRQRVSGRGARGIAVVATVAVLAIVLPGVTSTTASWNDQEWTHGDIGTSAFRCGSDSDYTTQSSSRFVSGTLTGVDLDTVAGVHGLDVTKPSTSSATVDPVTAPEITSTPTVAAFGNPLNVDVLGDVLGLDLTGLGVGLPAGSAGAVNQYAKATATGQSVAASGLVNDSGGVLVTDSTPPDRLPEPASLTLSQALPALSGVSDVGLEVGAVASSAELDGCALLRDAIWGGASTNVTGSSPAGSADAMTVSSVSRAAALPAGVHLVRDYGVAGLGLRVESPLVGSLVSSVDTTVTTLQSSIAQLSGTNGLLSQALQQNIVGALTNGLRLGTVSGTVTVDGADVAGAVRPLLTETLTDGTVSVELSSGKIRVDLAHLLGDSDSGLNGLPPNTELVINAAVLDGISTRVGTLLDAWTGRVTTALITALNTLQVRVALDVDLNLITAPLVQLNIRMNSGVEAIINRQSNLTVGTTLLGLNLGLLTGVVSALVSGLLTSLPTVIVSTLTSTLFTTVSSLGSTIAAAARPLLGAIGSVTDRLPSLLSITVNAHDDKPGTRNGTAVRSGAYTVTALRIRLLSALLPTGTAGIDLAKSTVGPAVIDLRRTSTSPS
ncbi:choice-of-anchor G family protein [Curtobacterium sp. MCSS17_015]|uniref:choice-of-anchor G family protein n=1 Tax=Curtobacterium sp. MCSS17_015 TaxID=2175666 RepID=UPI0015E8C0CE|nr:choice-of-anchor G family protein [Curtobacterium sp. MCSS17_015]WIB26727.1 choice-of-anchor G family protein [Curtobacterium sp. MCSS17_015]